MLKKINTRKNIFLTLSIFGFLLTFIILNLILKHSYNKKPLSSYSYDNKQVEKFVQDLRTKDPYILYDEIKKDLKYFTYVNKHNIGHIFGKAVYKSQGNKGILVCDKELSYGCFHGFFTESITTEGISVIPSLDSYCKSKINSSYSGCQHGIGHGLVEYFGRGQILKALAQCKLIQKNLLVGCSSGVFMEYFFPSPINPDSDTLKIDPKEPFKPCEMITEYFKNSCIFELPRLWRMHEPNFQVLEKRCIALPNPNHSKSCFRGLGYATGNSSKPDWTYSLSICSSLGKKKSITYCLSGASWFYATLEKSENTAIANKNLCKNTSEESLCRELADLNLDQMSN